MKLSEIAENLKTQDNRITDNPMFCVRVLERVVGLDPSLTDKIAFHNWDACETYFPDRGEEEWEKYNELYEAGELPRLVDRTGYSEYWRTVMACFTEAGCKEYLKQDGHNLRHFYGVDIYVESFNRNPEMLAIRKALMEGRFKEVKL